MMNIFGGIVCRLGRGGNVTGHDGACMREIFVKGVKKCNAIEEISLYVSHGKCMLNQCANLVSSGSGTPCEYCMERACWGS
jgi:hypothetical protein